MPGGRWKKTSPPPPLSPRAGSDFATNQRGEDGACTARAAGGPRPRGVTHLLCIASSSEAAHSRKRESPCRGEAHPCQAREKRPSGAYVRCMGLWNVSVFDVRWGGQQQVLLERLSRWDMSHSLLEDGSWSLLLCRNLREIRCTQDIPSNPCSCIGDRSNQGEDPLRVDQYSQQSRLISICPHSPSWQKYLFQREVCERIFMLMLPQRERERGAQGESESYSAVLFQIFSAV